MCTIPNHRDDLTKEWVETILRDGGEDIEVSEVDVDSRSSKHEKYTLRVVVSGRKNNRGYTNSIIVKMASDSHVSNLTVDMPTFPTEVEAYRRVFPDMLALQQRKKVLSLPVPRCFLASCRSMSGILVLQDLKQQGYQHANYLRGQTLDECRVVMQALARFHAVGYNLKFNTKKRMQERYLQLFTDSCSINANKLKNIFEEAIKVTASIIGRVPKYQDAKKRLREKTPMLAQMALKYLHTDQQITSTICHGECWSNNMMFKYDKENNKALEVKLLDFEFLSLYSPVNDLIYYFFCSTLPQLRKRYLKELLHTYHEELFRNLDALGVSEIDHSNFSFQILWNEFHGERIYLGLAVSLASISVALSICENLLKHPDATVFEGPKKVLDRASSRDPSRHPFVMKRISGLMDELQQYNVL